MSKAILKIEMPVSCEECPIRASYQPSAHSIREYWCAYLPGVEVESYQSERSPFCPLKNMPDEAPTVDAVEVVRGKWVDVKPPGNFSAYYPQCSACESWALQSGGYPCKTDFCPNCGAKMGKAVEG